MGSGLCEAAAVARARGYVSLCPCPGGVQPVLKPVVALGGEVVGSTMFTPFLKFRTPPVPVPALWDEPQILW